MIVGAVLLLLVVIGAPLFVIVGVLTALSLLTYTELTQLQDMRVLVQHVENLATKQEFLAIPLFMASGSIMTAGGIARRLVNLMRALLGGLPGGLAMAAVAACMVFAAISGSSPVTLIAVGSMMYPALVEADYPENFSLGLVTTAGSLGCLVPPSIAMLIYSISVSGSSGVDPSDLFLAGLMPALLVAGMLALCSMWVGRNMPRDTLKLGVRVSIANLSATLPRRTLIISHRPIRRVRGFRWQFAGPWLPAGLRRSRSITSTLTAPPPPTTTSLKRWRSNRFSVTMQNGWRSAQPSR